MNATTEEKNILNLHRTFAAPRERVFAAWTEPELVRQWFGGEGCELTGLEMDVRPGGAYRFCMKTSQGEMTVGGTYREVASPEKLVYTWQWEDDPAYADRETLVTVEFVDCGGSTEVRLTHENFPTAENVTNHQQGWTVALEKLDKLFPA